MMNIENIINFFLSISSWTVVKFFVLLAILIYVAFTFILVKQVSMMTKVVYGQFDFFLKSISWLLLILSLAVFLLALFTL